MYVFFYTLSIQWIYIAASITPVGLHSEQSTRTFFYPQVVLHLHLSVYLCIDHPNFLTCSNDMYYLYVYTLYTVHTLKPLWSHYYFVAVYIASLYACSYSVKKPQQESCRREGGFIFLIMCVCNSLWKLIHLVV